SFGTATSFESNASIDILSSDDEAELRGGSRGDTPPTKKAKACAVPSVKMERDMPKALAPAVPASPPPKQCRWASEGGTLPADPCLEVQRLLALPGLGASADIQQFIERKEAAMQYKDVQQMDGSINRLYWAPFPTVGPTAKKASPASPVGIPPPSNRAVTFAPVPATVAKSTCTVSAQAVPKQGILRRPTTDLADEPIVFKPATASQVQDFFMNAKARPVATPVRVCKGEVPCEAAVRATPTAEAHQKATDAPAAIACKGEAHQKATDAPAAIACKGEAHQTATGAPAVTNAEGHQMATGAPAVTKAEGHQKATAPPASACKGEALQMAAPASKTEGHQTITGHDTAAPKAAAAPPKAAPPKAAAPSSSVQT
ncbi:unnamed protein product, partial [Symbiodinium sp. CCMP2592]